jgi:hypothetical protein
MTLRSIVQLRVANALTTKPPSLSSDDANGVFVRRGVSKGVEDGRRPPAVGAGHS